MSSRPSGNPEPGPRVRKGWRPIRWRWFRPGYWGWRWRSSVSRESKIVSALIGLAAVAAGGYLAADTLGGPTSTTAAYETTVEKVVTLRERGRTVRRTVPVVRRVLVTTSTESDGTQVITRRIVSTVPVVRREVVTRAGEVRTVVETRRGRVVTQTRTRAVTDRRTVTNQQTLTNQQTVTNQQTLTNERRVTVTRPVTSTQVTTVTRPVTSTQVTTVVQTVPTTVMQTRTQTDTVTVPVTVTVTTGDGD